MQMSTTHSSFDQYCISHKTISHQAVAAPGPEVRRECPMTYFSSSALLAQILVTTLMLHFGRIKDTVKQNNFILLKRLWIVHRHLHSPWKSSLSHSIEFGYFRHKCEKLPFYNNVWNPSHSGIYMRMLYREHAIHEKVRKDIRQHWSHSKTLRSHKLNYFCHISRHPLFLSLHHILNKNLRYREEHSASVELSWCTLWHLSGEKQKICWLINHFYVIGHESYLIRRNNAK